MKLQLTGTCPAAAEGPVHRVRAIILTAYIEVAEAVGLDGQRMLRDAGFSPESLADPENRVPAESFVKLLERSAEMSGCDSFGLLMAERRDFARLGPLSLLLERLPNLREVVRACIIYRAHLNDITEIALEEADGTAVIRLDLVPGFWSVQMTDLMVGIAYRVLHGASHGHWRPSAVHLVRKQPQDLAPWRRFYPVSVDFENSFNGLSCSSASLLEPNPLADEVMARNARGLLRMVPVEETPLMVSEGVRRAIAQLLPGGRTTLDQVAAHMGMSARSLQRRLDEEGQTFGYLLNEVRRGLAAGYLADSDRPVTTVASLLGYGSPSSFTRWFVATFGTSPQAWRAERKLPPS
ncbi:MAG TPA: AraC family transcriptional regulator [Croceibacterium sp.]|nr:AraC family transcriptional regulator [Croceibacterium sp.]